MHITIVVHHGGAGTTAAAFRAGVPMVIVPFMGDQPYWGRRARELGVSTALIRRKKLTEMPAHCASTTPSTSRSSRCASNTI
jgi:UDP:flavonoid glycosyltransferase YjiC (YdhE family)